MVGIHEGHADKWRYNVNLDESTMRFPFKRANGKNGVLYRQKHVSENGTGGVLELRHHGHDHLSLEIRHLYRRNNGRIGNRRIAIWTMDAKTTVALGSLLLFIADEYLADSAEQPFHFVTSPDKAAFGPNWVREDQDSAIRRRENRKSRNELLGLMRRCVEVCDDVSWLQFLAASLGDWACEAGDGFAEGKALRAFVQLGMIPDEEMPGTPSTNAGETSPGIED